MFFFLGHEIHRDYSKFMTITDVNPEPDRLMLGLSLKSEIDPLVHVDRVKERSWLETFGWSELSRALVVRQ